MAREAKITQKDVDAICARLRANGRMPSVRLIRAEHGAGSTGTIQQMLRVWQAENPESDAGVTITTALQKALADNMGYEITRAKQEMNAKLEAADETINDLVTESEQLTGEVERLQQASDALMDGLATYKGQVTQLESDLASQRDAAALEREKGEAMRAELARVQLRIEQSDALQAEFKALQVQLENERVRREQAEKLAGVNGAQRDALAERLEEEKARTAHLALLVDKQSKDLTSAAVRVEAAQARLDSADYQLTAAKEQASKARAKAQQAQEEAAEWRGHVEELRVQVVQLQTAQTKASPAAGEG